MSRKIKLGFYRHYKEKDYLVEAIAIHSDTMEEYVVYRALYKGKFPEGQLWVKPVDDFLVNVDVNGVKKPRFRYLGKKLTK